MLLYRTVFLHLKSVKTSWTFNQRLPRSPHSPRLVLLAPARDEDLVLAVVAHRDHGTVLADAHNLVISMQSFHTIITINILDANIINKIMKNNI